MTEPTIPLQPSPASLVILAGHALSPVLTVCVCDFRGSKLAPRGCRWHRKLPPQLHQHPRLTNKRKHSDPRQLRRRTLQGNRPGIVGGSKVFETTLPSLSYHPTAVPMSPTSVGSCAASGRSILVEAGREAASKVAILGGAFSRPFAPPPAPQRRASIRPST